MAESHLFTNLKVSFMIFPSLPWLIGRSAFSVHCKTPQVLKCLASFRRSHCDLGHWPCSLPDASVLVIYPGENIEEVENR